MAEELKPCPFCGGDAVVRHILVPEPENKAYSVGCVELECAGSSSLIAYRFTTEEAAVEAWNSRPRCRGCIREGLAIHEMDSRCMFCSRNFIDWYEIA